MARVKVLTPLPLDKLLDYEDGGKRLTPGALVEVSVGARRLTGCVWDDGDADEAPTPFTLKTARPLEDAPTLDGSMRAFIDWAAAWTCAKRGLFLKMSLADGGGRPKKTAARRKASPPSPLPPATSARPWTLTPAQRRAAATLTLALGRGFSVHLLDGVTGSGKTFVYTETIARALKRNLQSLVLVPEIALTGQWLERVRARLGDEAPVVWHSALGVAERRRVWRKAASGDIRVVVGARSALFLPLPRLGLIVVDEEHDSSFKQEEGVMYHARDLAVARALKSNVPLLLASATPSLETVVNVEEGRYRRVSLPARYGAGGLPKVRLVDMTKEQNPRGRWISPTLERALKETLEDGGQSLLFLNRRGYAPVTVCRACGEVVRGRACGNALVLHKHEARMLCHYCGFAMKVPENCPSCGVAGKLAPCGPGVDRLEEEAAALFPKAAIAVLSSDRARGPAALSVIEAIEARKVDIVIGTQMMAKGHHFPALALVGAVDADIGLAGGDVRAAERCFQMLHQVGGRAGREGRKGIVYIQTCLPEHGVMKALKSCDRDGFLKAERANRRALNLPPYGRLAALILSARNFEVVEQAAHALAAAAPNAHDIEVLGPAPAPLAMVRGRHRWRLLVKGSGRRALAPYVRGWLAQTTLPSSLRVQIDIDPMSFL